MSEGIGGPLQYQLQMLAAEVDVVNATIRQMDDISKNLKQWTITVWAASVGGALSTASLTRYVWARRPFPFSSGSSIPPTTWSSGSSSGDRCASWTS